MQNWPIAGVKYAFIAMISIAILTFFSNSNAQNDIVSKAHHTPTGFKNNYTPEVNKSFGDFLRWQWESWGIDKTANSPTPSVQADLALLKAPASPTVTWMGHATALVQANGLNVLVDPVFSERASPVQIFGTDFHWYYAGDTGYSRDFADTARQFAPRQTGALGGGFDLALVPVGSYEPRWFMSQQHVNPMESVRIHQDVGAKRSIGVHWGTFALTDEPLDQPPRDLAIARQVLDVKATDFGILAIGESRQFDKRTPSTALSAR